MTSSEISEFEKIVEITLPLESSEEDVRTKIVIPLFRLLGYKDDRLATEFPVHGYRGRKKCPVTKADAVYFNDISPSLHREESERNWVRNHSLVLIEIKKPTEDPDPSGQAEYYANWLATPFIISTNGNEFIIRLQEKYLDPKELLRFKREDLVSHLADIQKILLYSRVVQFVLDEQLKSERIIEIDYEYYLSSLHGELKADLKWPIARFLGSKIDQSILDLSLEEKSTHEIKSSEDVLKSIEPIVILGEPGSGKTYLLKQLAKKLIESISVDETVRIPIIIKARYWGSAFKTIVDAIYDEIHIFVSGITIPIVEHELALGNFVILVDGFDEIRIPKDKFLLEIERLVRSRMAKIIITSREANYHGEFTTNFRAYKIEGISDDQIDAFAREAASISNFSYQLRNRNLLELARLPLYLLMLCELSMRNQARVFNNKAKIWEEFSYFLLEKYP